MRRYRIRDWDRRHETTRSRAMHTPRFVSVPLMLADRGYMRLMRDPDGAALWGVYVSLAMWQMARFGGEVRSGWLTDDGTEDGYALTADDLAVELHMSELTVSVALDVLSRRDVGLLSSVGGEDEREEERGAIGGETEGMMERGSERTERKRVGEDAVARPAPASPPAEAGGDRRTKRLQHPGPPSGGTVLHPAALPSDDLADGECERPDGGRMTDDGQRDGGRSAPLRSAGDEKQHPPATPLFLQLSALEIPCRDGVWTPTATLAASWETAYPAVDVAAQVCKMVAWAFGKLEGGARTFGDAWTVDSAPEKATNWLAEEQQKAEDLERIGRSPGGGGKRRGAAGAPSGDWRREVEFLDKLARGKRARIRELDDTYGFGVTDFDDRERARKKHAAEFKEWKSLKDELSEVTREMANVKRGNR